MRALHSILLILALSAASRAAEINFADLPKPVQRTINRSLDGGTVRSVIYSTRHAEPVYTIVLSGPGHPARTLHVNLRGDLIDLPAAPTVEVSAVNDGGQTRPRVS